ncbi:MAG: phosphate/phosphite/phosphonate ABC transporter substrate-binding protein [Gammaproteobacteria bacterium]|nr:phosphate/phosphite/phosphonate ABC transporter substrate-binding protein [Gammaproteobacteria bacterium]
MLHVELALATSRLLPRDNIPAVNCPDQLPQSGAPVKCPARSVQLNHSGRRPIAVVSYASSVARAPAWELRSQAVGNPLDSSHNLLMPMSFMSKLSRALCAILVLVFAQAVRADSSVFQFGVINERPDKPDFALRQFGAFHQYLEATLGKDGIEVGPLRIAQSLDEMAAMLQSGEVDALVEGVMPTLYLEDATAALEPALLVWRKGQRQYHSVFFVRQDSSIRSLTDLRGRTIAFESPRSTSAYFIPAATLAEHGLRTIPDGTTSHTEEPVVRHMFAGSEANQGYWTLAGKSEAGAFNDGDWQRLPDSVRSRLRVIHRTRPVLRWLISYRVGLEPSTRNAATALFTTMHENEAGRAALRQAERIARIEPLSQEDIRNLDAWKPVFESIRTLL